MARKAKHPNFEQMVADLRAHGFEVAPTKAVPDGMQVTMGGVGTVIVPVEGKDSGEGGSALLAVTPGIVVREEIARLLDRGYQKFIKTSQYELPATATQLPFARVQSCGTWSSCSSIPRCFTSRARPGTS